MVRLLSYNVHRCVGTDRKLDVGRIAAVIAAEEPDIVCLQEVDVGRARTGGVDQAHRIAERLGMKSRFHAALRVVEEEYGDAILTALPETLVKAGPLPGYARIPQLEPRGALWVEVEVAENQRLQVINTHLGLVPREQQLQAVEIAGPGWLASSLRRSPLALVGDFNAPPRSVVYRTFSGKLTDAEKVRPEADRAHRHLPLTSSGAAHRPRVRGQRERDGNACSRHAPGAGGQRPPAAGRGPSVVNRPL